MGEKHDENWLQNQLQICTGWDPMMVQGIVEALSSMDDPDEIEALIENVLSDSKARQLAEKFLAFKANKQGATSTQSSQSTSTLYPGDKSKPKNQNVKPQTTQKGSKMQSKKKAVDSDDDDDEGIGIFIPENRKKLIKHDRTAQKQQQQLAKPKQAPQQQQTMSINEAMSRPKKGKTKAKSAAIVRGEISLAQQLERKVMNCVKCGKVFDCRKVDDDVYRFLDSNGVCTFCGNKVKLTFVDGTTNWSQKDEENLNAYVANSSIEAAEKAEKLKNQLVEFDRHSAKRTQVIDDHTDFYEVDSNAWLTDEERQLMRERQRLEEQAAEAKRNKISFTVDLMGRKIMLADKDQPMSFEVDEEKQKILHQVVEANKQVAEQGGGSSIKETLEAAQKLNRQQLDENYDPSKEAPQKITPNPMIKGPVPVFLPTGGKNTSLKQKMQQRPQFKSQAAKKSEWSSRIQDDDIFEDFMTEIEIKYEDDRQAFKAAEKNQRNMEQEAFDLCEVVDGSRPKKTVGPALSPMAASFNPSKVHAEYNRINKVEGPRVITDSQDLPEGMVWLRQWIPLKIQTQIVQEIRKLGKGPAGFYQPSHVGGARHSMLMMCLGKHWEPRTGKYEASRSSYDGAIPKPIPQFMQDLVQQCIYDAQQVSGFRFPATKPDVAICNYYPPNKGSLGVHQDISEGSETLKRGLPVVSFSFGDIGDFVYGKTRDVNLGGLIKLASGDALVFGGPSRTIFHGVPNVYGGSAPSNFLKHTQMRSGRLNITFRQSL